jgi:two-component system, LytTR family, sensor kinase
LCRNLGTLTAGISAGMQRSHILWIAAGFWTLFGLISGIQVWISMITHGHSAPLLIGYFILSWQSWVFATWLILILAEKFPLLPVSTRAVLVHVLASLLAGIGHAVFSIGLMLLMQPYDKMTNGLGEIRFATMLFYRMPVELTLYFLVLGLVTAVDLYHRYREREMQAVQLEASLADARLHALELQLQPHFLFNTMNAISSLVRNRRNDEAVTMVSGLSDLLRYTLDHAGDQQVALEDELAVLRRYLEIQYVRFPDRMTFDIDLAPEARRAAVPALLLQPLAENAVRHGIARSAGPGVVEVRAYRADGKLRIEVFNSGTIGTSTEEGRGIGLRNTRARLQHLYGVNGQFELVPSRNGVLAALSIPWSEVA